MSSSTPISIPKEITASLEAVLFACGGPVASERLCELLSLSRDELNEAVKQLQTELEDAQRGIQLIRVENAYQLCTKPFVAETVKAALELRKSPPLSKAALEVLAIVAYRQPVTRSFIELVRGVDSASIVASLCDKGLLAERGTLDAPGRPTLFGTTDAFLRCFGLDSLQQLPDLPFQFADQSENGQLELQTIRNDTERHGTTFPDTPDETAEMQNDTERHGTTFRDTSDGTETVQNDIKRHEATEKATIDGENVPESGDSERHGTTRNDIFATTISGAEKKGAKHEKIEAANADVTAKKPDFTGTSEDAGTIHFSKTPDFGEREMGNENADSENHFAVVGTGQAENGSDLAGKSNVAENSNAVGTNQAENGSDLAGKSAGAGTEQAAENSADAKKSAIADNKSAGPA